MTIDNNGNNGKSKRYPTYVLFGFASIAVMVMYVEAMSFPSLPMVMADFGLTTRDYALASWVVTVYLIVGAVAIPVFSKLGDIYGKKKMLVIAMSIYTVAVTITGFSRDISDSIYVMIAFRAFQGLAMSMFPLAFSIIRDEFPRDKVPVAQGVISAMFGVGTSVGILLGAYVTDTLGWEWTYHTVAPFALVATLLVATRVRESPVRLQARPDYVGAALLGTTLVTFLVGVTETRNRGWTDPLVLSLLGVSGMFLAAFSYWLTREKDPLIRPGLLRDRDIAIASVSAFIIGFGLFMSNQTIVSLAGFNFGLAATGIGLLLLPSSLVTLFLGPTVGMIVRKRGPKWPVIFGMALAIVGFSLLLQWHSTQQEVMVNIAIMGAGTSFLMVGSINMVIISTPPEETGISTGMNTVIRTAGGVVGPAIAAAIISEHTSVDPVTHLPLPPADVAYQTIFTIAIIVGVIGLALSFFYTDKRILPSPSGGAAGPVGQATASGGPPAGVAARKR